MRPHAGHGRTGAAALLRVALLLLFCTGSGEAGVRGHLLIIGGGKRTPEIMQRFIDLAGGADRARIVVFPMASGVPDTTGMEQAEQLRRMGVRDVRWMLFDRATALRPGFADTLNGTTGVFFSGGDQSRLTAVIAGTPVHEALLRLHREGAVMGGTSAGAAVMSSIMLTGNELRNADSANAFIAIQQGNIETVQGLGFTEDIIVDQHFVRRKRLNRLLSVVLEHPRLPGVGIDEATAIDVAPDGGFTVLGEGTVVVFDARMATGIHADRNGNLGARGIITHILSAGEQFDPAGR